MPLNWLIKTQEERRRKEAHRIAEAGVADMRKARGRLATPEERGPEGQLGKRTRTYLLVSDFRRVCTFRGCDA